MFESRLSICFAVLWAVFAFPGVGRAQSQPSQPVVGIDVGRISGVIEDSVRAFKGIPYAAPPIGPPPLEASPPSRALGLRATRRQLRAGMHPAAIPWEPWPERGLSVSQCVDRG